MLGVFRRRGLQEVLALTGALLAAAAMAARPARAAETFSVNVDQARLLRVPASTNTLVVGNPLIADVSVQSGGLLVVTGKGYGSTNLMALDRGGNVVAERIVQVSAPKEDVVQVFRGMERETLTCAPICQPRVTLGDSPNFFNPTLQQTGSRNGSAQGAGGPPGPGGTPAPR